MTLQYIDLETLTPAAVNVRRKGGKEIANLIPSIRSLGLLQPLLVRSDGDGYEIIAGQRRYHALCAIAHEAEGSVDPVPCIVMAEGDDAKAIEASLAENIARLPTDEIDQYKAFAALVKAGETVEEIAARFGVTERLVTQRMAIANLYGPILTAYRREEVDAGTMRILTMATAKQQKAWFALFKSEGEYAPTGHRLKDWLFGGGAIPVSNALFDVEASGLAVIGDLFGEDRYFTDSAGFWTAQNIAIAEIADQYRAKGWSSVIVHDVGERFQSWHYAKLSKNDGGEVHIAVSPDGKVETHEGVIDRDVLRKRQKAKETGKAAPQPKPEITRPMRNYLGLHRHASVRSDLLAHPSTALRLIAAHMLAGSSLWSVRAEPQRADKEIIAESLAANPAQARFETEREAVAALLDSEDARDIVSLFETLTVLIDEDVTRILAFLMAESLEAHTPLVERVGAYLVTDPMRDWSPDETFIDLLREKAVINAMVGEVAGEQAAKGNVAATVKTQKGILKACLSGERESDIADWRPRYMSFPMGAYTERSGGAEVEAAHEQPRDQADLAEAA